MLLLTFPAFCSIWYMRCIPCACWSEGFPSITFPSALTIWVAPRSYLAKPFLSVMKWQNVSPLGR